MEHMVLSKFADWLAKQDQSATYDYWSCSGCPIAQYLKSVGTSYREAVMVHGGFDLLRKWNEIVTAADPWTYGAALTRAAVHINDTGRDAAVVETFNRALELEDA